MLKRGTPSALPKSMENNKTHFIVQTASTRCASKFGVYRKVAILEVEEGLECVSMISSRAKGCVQVVAEWDRLNVGKTDKSAYYMQLADAEDACKKLNSARALLREWRC